MLKQVIEAADFLDRASFDSRHVANFLASQGLEDAEVKPLQGVKGNTLFLRILVPGGRGREAGGAAPTLGVIGYLGGVGARPERIGMVSDADGAVTALAVAAKLASMARRGDQLPGDVWVTTHLTPDAPVIPHRPVPFMGSNLGIEVLNDNLVDASMEAVLSIDTTRGNWIVNNRGFAITPTVKEGWILPVDETLLELQQYATGRLPNVVAISTLDITPYGNGLPHLNSILQPATVTTAPVVGVAITAATAVPGCATGACQEVDIEEVARFVVEAAKSFSQGDTCFYRTADYQRLQSLYGKMDHLQKLATAKRSAGIPK